MSMVLHALKCHALERPDKEAIVGDGIQLTYRELISEVRQATNVITERRCKVLSLALDNGPAWAIWDLAAQQAGVTLVPLPGFFTPEQALHTLSDAGVEAVIHQDGGPEDPHVAGQACQWRTLEPRSSGRIPPGTAKITYTSGTTGRPKGVCLSQPAIDRVVRSLAEAVQSCPDDRHLALLPLSILLENIGGLYIPLFAGATAILEPMSRMGVSGSSQLAAETMLEALRDYRATTAIMVPAQLDGLVTALESGLISPPDLRFLAVGGGAVAPRLLKRADAIGLPVFQGYGLSECASVVAVNRPGEEAFTGVGRPLCHADVKIAEDGEVQVHAPGFLGYLNGELPTGEWWPTGDLGYLDARGALHLTGRKKSIFITAFGRNVAPEWVEAELTAEPEIVQAAVFGEARPWNSAVVVSPASASSIAQAVSRANQRLPDYASIHRWLRADAPFSTNNGMATANGHPRREAIFAAYRSPLDSLYENQEVTP
ncbi:AMP-binding protein [Thiohalomonas denitrificans]|uniref:AMP-binding protein n=1 Tax=Thiohalomonas denitrificans TaxID=415747 RepID=UPI0026EFFBCB|nr:AMP-binding protein [Thiohalomonas denitrificans]